MALASYIPCSSHEAAANNFEQAMNQLALDGVSSPINDSPAGELNDVQIGGFSNPEKFVDMQELLTLALEVLPSVKDGAKAVITDDTNSNVYVTKTKQTRDFGGIVERVLIGMHEDTPIIGTSADALANAFNLACENFPDIIRQWEAVSASN